MDFALDEVTEEFHRRLRSFMTDRIEPARHTFATQLADNAARGEHWSWDNTPVMQELQEEARARGLWNLFLTGEHGAGLTNLQYAPLAELSGHAIHLAPPAMNCAAPDSGNIDVLTAYGNPEQQERWLIPLLEGRTRSAFAMTEPDVASSDATNIETRITRHGDRYLVNGRKWWVTGALNPGCAFFIVMGKTDPDAKRHRQQSMILVPRNTPGVQIVRPLHVLGFDDHEHGGHAEISFTDVEVPATHLISEEGDGFAIAQARLGPGRIHHCMRAIGLGEMALEAMSHRATRRITFGSPLASRGTIQDWIADARVRLEQLRLLTLKTAWLMDTRGNHAAHTEIQAIKIAVPHTVQTIIDRAIQVHGAAGLCQDHPLAEALAGVRSLRIADGPDEVHKSSLARHEIRRHTGQDTKETPRSP
ncbi:acyl-CoA dehydrogenase [Austwickia chelonae]|uniref:Putative acyl-CoA dehydrogenase n=1 Tax=Austwickia chelonae NBRC 105200 TaxID=1184607 RepID=K6V4W2_9MICO|nr:acyl-CoA dehydrogenase family protein [Austwickia chelonae]GAB77218.1 putative acyl-CoA dehydrogenase [Austwickia chelonae NBRC 105200]SEW05402.1 acyl-CoA dehydrogenase [Austwickia chelonae]